MIEQYVRNLNTTDGNLNKAEHEMNLKARDSKYEPNDYDILKINMLKMLKAKILQLQTVAPINLS